MSVSSTSTILRPLRASATVSARAASLTAALLLVATVGAGGCKKADEDPVKALTKELLNVRVVGTPLELRVPPDWRVADIDPEDLAPPPGTHPDGQGDGGTTETDPGEARIKLTGRLMFSARAPKGARGEGEAAPRIEIFHDPWLPVGTSARDYLETQREENERAVREGKGGAARIRHVESERSRRDGRPTYHVRDEFTFKVGSQRAVVSQESLLLVDQDDNELLHGYTVVMTMTQEDLEQLDITRRAVIGSVHFAKR